MRVDLFDFDLPDDRIALRPAEPRDAARLLVVQPHEEHPFTDEEISDLPRLLEPGDCLVFNDTKVIPARLHGIRHRQGATGAQVEVTLHQRLDQARWLAFARPAKRLKKGDRVHFGQGGKACSSGMLDADVETRDESGQITLRFALAGAVLDEAITAHGEMPLPPYIVSKRAVDQRDKHDYQTIYAHSDGAVAAPTAGLHFTPRLFEALDGHRIGCKFITLHVGAGTFLPVRSDNTDGHRMHGEWCEASAVLADTLSDVRNSGGRVIAVGTTSMRLLETAAAGSGEIAPYRGTTELFITPGYRFLAVDGLLTNFHLPRSTLFMLVSAFCGLDLMQAAYAHAITNNYRFYSYGDASLLWPAAK